MSNDEMASNIAMKPGASSTNLSSPQQHLSRSAMEFDDQMT